MQPSVPLCSLYIFLLIANQVAADWSSLFFATNVTTNARARQRRASQSKGRLKPDTNIITAQPAMEGEYPYAASIWKASIKPPHVGHICGGSVLSADMILTAAHCLFNESKEIMNASDMTVHLGWANNSNTDRNYFFPVKHIYMPKKYDYRANVGSGYDIALLRLGRKINFQKAKHIKTISLPNNELDLPIAHSCIVLGWGATESHMRSDWLLHLNVPILDVQTCQQVYKNGFRGDYDSDSLLCAGYTNDRDKDSCASDSGGPLVCRRQSDPMQYRQYGIGAFGEEWYCGEVPGFYTKVMRFVRMIKKYSK